MMKRIKARNLFCAVSPRRGMKYSNGSGANTSTRTRNIIRALGVVTRGPKITASYSYSTRKDDGTATAMGQAVDAPGISSSSSVSQKWKLTKDGKAMERGFKFKGFKGAWKFMQLVAEEASQKKHHPEWSNVYNKTYIRWTTHSSNGLTEKDRTMASFCDEAATQCNEEEEVSLEGFAATGALVDTETEHLSHSTGERTLIDRGR